MRGLAGAGLAAAGLAGAGLAGAGSLGAAGSVEASSNSSSGLKHVGEPYPRTSHTSIPAYFLLAGGQWIDSIRVGSIN